MKQSKIQKDQRKYDRLVFLDATDVSCLETLQASEAIDDLDEVFLSSEQGQLLYPHIKHVDTLTSYGEARHGVVGI